MATKAEQENVKLREEIAVIRADRDNLLKVGQDRAEEAKALPEFDVLVDGGSRMKIVKARINGVIHRFQCVYSPNLKSFIATSKYMSEGEEALAHDDMNWFKKQIESRGQDSAPVDTASDDIPFEV